MTYFSFSAIVVFIFWFPNMIAPGNQFTKLLKAGTRDKLETPKRPDEVKGREAK